MFALLAATPSSKFFFNSVALATAAGSAPAAPGTNAKLNSAGLPRLTRWVWVSVPSLSTVARDLVAAGLQADLDELAAPVALDLELAVHAVRELDDDLRAHNGLAFGVGDLALDHAGLRRSGRREHEREGQRQRRHMTL